MLLPYCLACIHLLCGNVGMDEHGLITVSISDMDQSNNVEEEHCKSGEGIGVWRNEPIASWLRERTDFQQLTKQQATRFVELYGIDEFPALLVLTHQGELVDLFTGCLEASDVFELLKLDWEWHVGRTFNRSARATAMACITKARDLNRAGHYGKAFEAYVSCYDDLVDLPSIYTTDLSLRILGDIKRLGEKYAPAKAWIQTLAAQLEDRIVSCRGDESDIRRFAFLCKGMNNRERLMSAYEKVKGSNCETLIREMAGVLADELIRTKRYSDINARQEAEAVISRYTFALKAVKSGIDNKPRTGQAYTSILDILLNDLLEKVGMYYRCLLLAGRDDDAKAVADKLLKITRGSSEAYLCLAWNGYLSGRVNDDHLAYAREVYERSPIYVTSQPDISTMPHGVSYYCRMNKRLLAAVLLIKLYRARGMHEAARTLVAEVAKNALTWDKKLLFEELERELGKEQKENGDGHARDKGSTR